MTEPLPDDDNVYRLSDRTQDVRMRRSSIGRPPARGGGGGGGVPPELGERVAKLEARLEELPTRKEFAALSEAVGRVAAKLEELPTRKEFAALQTELTGVREKVGGLPTWIQIMSLVGSVLVLSTAFSNADRIIRAWRETSPPVAAGPASAAPPPISPPGTSP